MLDQPLRSSYLVSDLRMYNLAYLHVTEPRIGGNIDVDAPPQSSNKFPA
jgi:NADPH2 dehydrogenase